MFTDLVTVILTIIGTVVVAVGILLTFIYFIVNRTDKSLGVQLTTVNDRLTTVDERLYQVSNETSEIKGMLKAHGLAGANPPAARRVN